MLVGELWRRARATQAMYQTVNGKERSGDREHVALEGRVTLAKIAENSLKF